MDYENDTDACKTGEYIGGIWVPADPMDMLQCESCQ